jgi:uncharacterized integral membrane protein
VFALIGAWPLVHGAGVRWWSLAVAGVLLVVTLAAPALLAVPNRLWARFGLLLNRIVSPVVLGIVFFAVVTPMSLVMRLLGKDPLRLRRSRQDASYWIAREPPGPKPDSLRNQF